MYILIPCHYLVSNNVINSCNQKHKKGIKKNKVLELKIKEKNKF